MTDTLAPTPTLNLTRWTVTSGSNSQSRGAVVITAGSDHSVKHWDASGRLLGAIGTHGDAIAALAEILNRAQRECE